MQRLIKIARPIDLMPLHTEAKKIDSGVKKSQTLPLFGKRGTFKYSTVTTENRQPRLANPIQHQIDGNKSDEEEMEEIDEKDSPPPSANKSISDDEQPNVPSTSARLICNTHKEIEMQNDMEADNVKVEDRTLCADDDEDNGKSNITNGNHGSNCNSSSSSNTSKKKRNRIRVRTDKGRENVDFDEVMVDTEKYSTWVPPQGQSGDGSTDLNEKYGY